jgi:hypothetical protein
MSQSTRATPPNSLPTPTHRLVVVLEVLGDIPRGLAVRAQADEPVHDVLVLDAPVVQHGESLFDQLVRLGGSEGHESVDLGRGRRRGVVHCQASLSGRMDVSPVRSGQ